MQNVDVHLCCHIIGKRKYSNLESLNMNNTQNNGSYKEYLNTNVYQNSYLYVTFV